MGHENRVNEIKSDGHFQFFIITHQSTAALSRKASKIQAQLFSSPQYSLVTNAMA